MIVDIVDLVDDLSNVMILITEVLNLIEEVLNLLLLDFKFTVFDVEIEYLPNMLWTKLGKVRNFVLGDKRDIELVDTDHFQDFEDLVVVVLCLLDTSLVIS